jgi:hypothetical protein
MTNRIWEGQCEDCYERLPLRKCGGEVLPKGIRAELCTACIINRERERAAGKPPRPIGIPADEQGMEWIDLGKVVSYQDGSDTKDNPVAVRFSFPVGEITDQVGIVRFQFEGGEQWFPAAPLDFFVPNIQRNPKWFAATSVTGTIRNKMLPHAKTKIMGK